jgi:hypothetical protein
MNRHPRSRFWFEATCAAVCFAAALLTAVWSDWIETVFNVDPDHGNGSLEWGLVVVLFGVALCLVVVARTEWCRALPAGS